MEEIKERRHQNEVFRSREHAIREIEELEKIEGQLLDVDATVSEDFDSLEEEEAEMANQLQRVTVSTCMTTIF